MTSYLLPLGALLPIAVAVLIWNFVRNRGKWAMAAGIVCIAVLGISAAGLILSFLFEHFMCGEYLLSPVASPAKDAVAQVREFDCGATTPFTSYVRVRSTNSIAGRLGLTHWSEVFTIEHDPRLISIAWTGPHELTIRHPIPDRHPEYLKCNAIWRDVTIKCQSYTPDEGTPLLQLPEPNRWLW